MRSPFYCPTGRLLRRGLIAGVMALALPAQADNHALIMGILNYANPAANLPGIDLDMGMGRKIALAMGVPEQNITEIKDGQVASSGVAAAFESLVARLDRGDNVFVYYSGHGGQTEGKGGSKCTEGMFVQDMKLYEDNRLEGNLKALSGKVGKLVFMNDSCFSGGQAEAKSTRALQADPTMKAKFWKGIELAPTGMASTAGATKADYRCGDAINAKMTRNLVPESARAGANMVYIAAASDKEVAMATSNGSAATLAWLQCMNERSDTDGSGSLTGEEIRRCAQSWLDNKGFNQHVTLVGNEKLPLAFIGGNTAAVNAPAALEDLRRGGSSDLAVRLTLANARLRINQDFVDFSIETRRPGYLTILHVGTDGRTFDKLFPNDFAPNNYVQAGVLRMPGPDWRVRAGGPRGTGYLLAVLSETPRKFGADFDRAGPFRSGSGSAATRNLVVESTGADYSQPGRYGTSEVVRFDEVE